MNRFTFQQIEELFHAAVDHDPPTRRVYLDRIAHEHGPDVSAMVERLLSHDGSDTRWTDLGLTSEPTHEAPELEPPGMLIGRYRLIRRLGYGGHGEVYLAEQIEPVRRTVALKMVRGAAASEASIARFRAEQQAMALMSHPNIASVYEAGLADRGRMYFAMAYVDGEPIDAYCDHRRMTVRERLALFLEVCSAVQHAHQKGLIHRDLKPSNILVTERDGEPQPMLIDFGIAMATLSNDQAGGAEGGPRHGALGTPAFMSPEQAGPNPQDLDTRSDVFSLGILLYELLTVRTPLDLRTAPDASLAEIRRCIVEERAPSPAAILAADEPGCARAAANRGCSPKQLQREVRGDLDAIVMKAVAHDRDDRYQTADALATDIENALHHRPVTVGSRRPAARMVQFVRRHRVVVAVATVVLTALLVAAIGTGAGMVRAARAARETNAVNSFLEDVLTSSRALEKGSTVRFVEVLAQGSAMAERRFADYPLQAGEVHALLGQTYVNLGLYRDARHELEQSLSLLRASAGMNDPRTLRTANTLASLLAAMLQLNDSQELAEEVARIASAHRSLRDAFLTSQRVLCDVMLRRGEAEAAEAKLRELIPRIDIELGTDHTEAYNARLALSAALNRQTVALGERRESDAIRRVRLTLLEEMLQLQQARFEEDADAIPILGSKLGLAQAHLDLRHYREAGALLETLLPRIVDRVGRVHGLYCDTAIAVAGLRYAQGDYVGAADQQLDSLEASRELHSPKHPNVLGIQRDTLPYLDAANRIEEGLRFSRELHDTLESMLGPDDGVTRDARAWVARFCDRAGLIDEADEHFGALLQGEANATQHGADGYATLFYAGHLTRLRRFEEAEATLLALSEQVGGITVGVSSAAHRDDLARMFLEVYRAWKRPEKVREYEAVVASMHAEAADQEGAAAPNQ